MKRLFTFIFAAMPLSAFAAGTYYTGQQYQPVQAASRAGGSYYSGYQQPVQQQQNYYRPVQSAAYNPANSRYSGYGPVGSAQPQQQSRATAPQSADRGFYLGGDVGMEYSSWEFDMNTAGSALSYDAMSWLTFNIGAGYIFDIGNGAGLKLDAGLKLGMQTGESRMIDDDISAGGIYEDTYFYDANSNGVYDAGDQFIGDIYGHAVSVGASGGGSMLGWNLGLGLTDKFAIGNLKLTPSIGYRSLNYRVSTNKNFGMSVETGRCYETDAGEVNCDPLITWTDGNTSNPSYEILWDDPDNDYWKQVATGWINSGGTYYFQQAGTSHKYDVTWAGPYLALDMDYAINATNAVNARIELGLPAYTSVGDQPYRFDWAHPKSVEDTSGFGDAYHLGMGATYKTAITNTVYLNIGFNYDYYSVSGASATTYLSGKYYEDLYWGIIDYYYGGDEAAGLDAGDEDLWYIQDTFTECPNWTCKQNKEVNSFYKSLGIRIGLSGKF